MTDAPELDIETPSEADRLLETLSKRVEGDDTYIKYFERFHERNDVDRLQCYVNVFHDKTPQKYVAIDYCYDAILRYTDRKTVADFMTAEMIDVHLLVEEIFTKYRITSIRDAGYQISVFIFEHMDKVDDILELVCKRRMVDVEKIAAFLEEVDMDSVSRPLRSGLL